MNLLPLMVLLTVGTVVVLVATGTTIWAFARKTPSLRHGVVMGSMAAIALYGAYEAYTVHLSALGTTLGLGVAAITGAAAAKTLYGDAAGE